MLNLLFLNFNWLLFLLSILRVESIQISDLFADKVELSHADTSRVGLQSGSIGWFGEAVYSGNGCKSNSLFTTEGLLINQCLFSPKQGIYFEIICPSSNEAQLFLFHDSACQNQIIGNGGTPDSATYPLNTCFFENNEGISYNFQCSSSNSQSLPLPTTKNLVVYEYYGDSDCATTVQYTSYAQSICILSGDGSVSYNYPVKTTYSNPTCKGSGVSSSLETNTCFDWVSTYGYNADDSINPYGPWVIISEYSTTSAHPTAYPSFKPSAMPSISLAPTTAFPTYLPTIQPSFHPTTTASPSFSPTKRPTAVPSISLVPTTTASPSFIPTFAPSFVPSKTLSPTATLPPTDLPTAFPTYFPTPVPSHSPKPSAMPTVSLAPSNSPHPTGAPQSPSKQPKVFQPTRIPTTGPDYEISFSVFQSFSNADCAYFRANNFVNILSETISLTLTGKQFDQPISVNNITIIRNSNCNISYELVISSIHDLGFVSPNHAYNTTIWELTDAVDDGDFNENWNIVALELNANPLQNITTVQIAFGSQRNSEVVDTTSQSSDSSSNIVAIAASVSILSFCFLVMCVMFIVRYVARTKYKVHHDIEGTVELAEARYMDDGVEPPADLVIPASNLQLPHAQPVTGHIIADCEPV